MHPGCNCCQPSEGEPPHHTVVAVTSMSFRTPALPRAFTTPPCLPCMCACVHVQAKVMQQHFLIADTDTRTATATTTNNTHL